jgi:hypothetical protein
MRLPGGPQPSTRQRLRVKAHASRERAPAPGVDNGWRSSAQMYLTPREHRLAMTQALPVLRLSRDGHLHPAAASLGYSTPLLKHCLCVTKKIRLLQRKSSCNFGKYSKIFVLQADPESRRTTPESRRATPESRRATPESRRTTPESRRTTPESSRTTPESHRTTPESRRATPESRRTTPESHRATPESRRTTPGSRRTTPESRRTTPESRRATPSLTARLAPVILSRRSRGFLRRRTTKDPLRRTRSALSGGGPATILGRKRRGSGGLRGWRDGRSGVAPSFVLSGPRSA